MPYLQFVKELRACAEEDFAAFQRRLIFTPRGILGVRTPKLREIAKRHKEDFEEIFSFPDEYYEVVFIKLAIAASLPYERFVEYLPQCVALIDCWALCDCFKAHCIRRHKREFLPYLEKIFARGGEYDERYVLVTLLSYYKEKEDLSVAYEYLRRADTSRYYVSMAAAWLAAEIVIRHFEDGKELLQAGILDRDTHRRAIQKAVDSYRFTQEQKDAVRALKIK